jgi:NAD(P)H-hydrate epimerase
MVVGGAVNYTGAPMLAGKAAYRIGAGLVTLAVPTSLHAALAGHIPEATWLLLPDEVGVIAASGAGLVRQRLDRITCLAIGPGMGLEETTLNFLRELIRGSGSAERGGIGFVSAARGQVKRTQTNLPPLVIDADGLKLLARINAWQEDLPTESVLTPHPGEMAALTGLEKAEIQADRLAVAEKFAQEWGQTVVLKGAGTVVASPDGRSGVIPVASPALARAGTGDVLTGIIAGLVGQGVGAYDAALAGTWIHAQAGVLAAEILGSEASVVAGDVLDAISYIL